MKPREGVLSWVHFGDLHIRKREDENYIDFLELIDAANRGLSDSIDLAFLPGDNAEDGVASQYELVRDGVDRLKLPVHIITGDHDRKAGTLDAFQRYLEPKLYRAITLGAFRLLFLNAMDGRDEKTFDLGPKQFQWLQNELGDAQAAGLRPLVFVHLYPSELSTKGKEFSHLIRDYAVEVVEMGHTHYNELANDSHTVYATTRSTGQIEEGPPGFSLTVVDNDVISWKFKQRGPWPFVMITSPADQRLITRPESRNQVVRGTVNIRAKAWGHCGITSVLCVVDGQAAQTMHQTEDGFWQLAWDSAKSKNGSHSIRVEVNACGDLATDEVSVLADQSGSYRGPYRHAVDFENTVGAWPTKGILGTQLGPNECGTKGPWPSWRNR